MGDQPIREPVFSSSIGRIIRSVVYHPGYRNQSAGLSGVELFAYETGIQVERVKVMVSNVHQQDIGWTAAEIVKLCRRFPEFAEAFVQFAAIEIPWYSIHTDNLPRDDKVRLLEIAMKAVATYNLPLGNANG